jgi:hypothetical protein
MTNRYVVLSAARPRSTWFAEVAQWANAGALPIEFIKCVGVDEALSKASTSRAFSAALLDAGMSGLDRDTIQLLRDANVAVLIVSDARIDRDWVSLGANKVLSPNVSKAELLDALVDTATLIPSVHDQFDARTDYETNLTPIRATIVSVVGSGGAGTTTVAMAIAEAFGHRDRNIEIHSTNRSSRSKNQTVLADFCLNSELAMLHDTQHISPGLQELVDAHRLSRPEPHQIQDMCFDVKGRSYDLLIGLRRRRLWTTIRKAACTQALQGLASTYKAIVIDTDNDFEGESENGSADVEDRNLLARTSLQNADHVVVVGHASLKGLHGLCRIVGELREFGVADERIHPVLNFAPRSARARAGYTKALADLLGTDTHVFPPLFIPFQPVDDRVRAVAPLPEGVTKPLRALIDRFDRRHDSPAAISFHRITPGFLKRANS